MSGTVIVARLALRELWITFRLLVILAAFVTAGAVVALLPAPLPVLLERLALALGAAILVVAVLSALAIADERRDGRAGWLVTRSVSRGAVLGGWFVALALLAVIGTGVAGVLGWLAASTVTLHVDPVAFGAAVAAVAATAVAAVAVGLLAGVVVPGRLAAVAAAAVVGAVGALAWLASPSVAVPLELVPGAAIGALAGMDRADGAGVAWRSAGAALVAAGAILLLARVAIDRVEL